MNTIFIASLEFHQNINIDKCKLELSKFGKIEDYNRKICNRQGIIIKEIYNDSISLEELNQDSKLTFDLVILDSGKVFGIFNFNHSEKFKFKNSDEKKGFFQKKRKFKNSEVESFSLFLNQFIFIIQGIDKIVPQLSNLTYDDQQDPKSEKMESLLKKDTLINHIPTFSSFNFNSSSTGSSTQHILIDKKDDTMKVISRLTKETIQIDDNRDLFFTGKIDDYLKIQLNKHYIEQVPKGLSSSCKSWLSEIDEGIPKLIKNIDNKNEYYWKHISDIVEISQLRFVQAKNRIFDILDSINNYNDLSQYFTRDYLETSNMEHERKMLLVYELIDKINGALINVATPINSRNQTKLQESTDKVNDRILFLSFIAMTIPLITSISSDSIGFNTKIISFTVILALPIIYILITRFKSSKNRKQLKLNNFKDDLKDISEQLSQFDKDIKEIEDSDFDSQFKEEVINTKNKMKDHLKARKLELEEKMKDL